MFKISKRCYQCFFSIKNCVKWIYLHFTLLIIAAEPTEFDYLQAYQRVRQTNKTKDAFPERNHVTILTNSCWDFQPAIPRRQRYLRGQRQHKQRWVLALDWLTCSDVVQVRQRVVPHRRHVSDASDRGHLLSYKVHCQQARCCSSLYHLGERR